MLAPTLPTVLDAVEPLYKGSLKEFRTRYKAAKLAFGDRVFPQRNPHVHWRGVEMGTSGRGACRGPDRVHGKPQWTDVAREGARHPDHDAAQDHPRPAPGIDLRQPEGNAAGAPRGLDLDGQPELHQADHEGAQRPLHERDRLGVRPGDGVL